MKKNGMAKKGKTDISENISKQSLDNIKYVPITTIKKPSLYSSISSNILPQTENNNNVPGNIETATAEVLGEKSISNIFENHTPKDIFPASVCPW